MSRRNTKQSLTFLATIVNEIAWVDKKFVSHWSVKYRQGHWSRCTLSEDVEEQHYARFEGSINYS